MSKKQMREDKSAKRAAIKARDGGLKQQKLPAVSYEVIMQKTRKNLARY